MSVVLIRFIYLYICLNLLSIVFSNQIYISREGEIDFYSSTPIEDIRAYNNQVSCVLNIEKGTFAFQVPIKGFEFKNALMQEHFNESYLESDIYPKSVFKGKINNWEDIQLTSDSLDVTIKGELTIHGVTKEIKESGKIWKNGEKLEGVSKFEIAVKDYGIEIPRLVRDNIAKIIDINIRVSLKQK